MCIGYACGGRGGGVGICLVGLGIVSFQIFFLGRGFKVRKAFGGWGANGVVKYARYSTIT